MRFLCIMFINGRPLLLVHHVSPSSLVSVASPSCFPSFLTGRPLFCPSCLPSFITVWRLLVHHVSHPSSLVGLCFVQHVSHPSSLVDICLSIVFPILRHCRVLAQKTTTSGVVAGYPKVVSCKGPNFGDQYLREGEQV